MRAKHFLCFNNNRRFGTSKPVSLIGCCPFKVDSSFVVDSLFMLLPLFVGVLCLVIALLCST